MTESDEEKIVRKGDKTDRVILDARITFFGQRLRESMKGETTAKFAKRCGLSDRAIWNYLDGLTYPSLDKIATLAHASNTSIEWLILGLDTSGSTSCDDTNQQQKQPTLSETLEAMTPEDAKLLLSEFLDMISKY
ncbi:helix-turn-helix domain-containing protein [Photorhabdus luminescens]|uniref:HTH cro/C1-type domain-containing protein n=1 Tax=Photorhabdus luminescens subsp. mexicana TaxID=2100167 RepID=A0A4R4ITV8_PHOLU|nr:helix-turn-helix transcriptional regulator [Photorhabdus luminescens]TDB44287.1 hypothetical protein C5468_22470 [Photorhabdus luminescens subsp. mexicana]